MSEHTPIPVAEAKRIAESFNKSIVVILAYDPHSERLHTTTYGVLAAEKLAAVKLGETCANAVGAGAKVTSYEDFRHDPHGLMAGQFGEATELLCQALALYDGRQLPADGENIETHLTKRVRALLALIDKASTDGEEK